MREKIISIILIIIFLGVSFPVVESYQSNNQNPIDDIVSSATGLPDLVCSLDLVKIGEWYYVNYSVTNIGDKTAKGVTMNVTVYPFGCYFLDIEGFLLKNLPFDIAWPILEFIVLKLHIWPGWLMGSNRLVLKPLFPGETVSKISAFPVDLGIDEFYNAKLCIIVEGIVDRENTVIESNESNNKEILRCWLPLNTAPSKILRNI
ncbi:MAG: hypothetical protein DRN27_05650 [Thermoplasmata archaeon]|nr:MAG: hypothetical protein DRN27_05650 [Thermoplasmata archaeon]